MVVFIVIDALRARNLSCHGYPRQTSPNIDNLARQGILCNNAYSCGITTIPSLTSIFSGNYPISHGIVDQTESTILSPRSVERLRESGTIFLPEILKSKTYTVWIEPLQVLQPLQNADDVTLVTDVTDISTVQENKNAKIDIPWGPFLKEQDEPETADS